MTLKELSDQAVRECGEKAARIDAAYNRGLLTGEDARNEKIRIAAEAWNELRKLCDKEKIDLKPESDALYQALFESAGIHIKKVPVRYYPGVERLTGSIYYIYGLENTESLFRDNDPIGKTFEFKTTFKMGDEKVPVDYLFEVRSENYEFEEEGHTWEGWRCFDGTGKLDGYHRADASVNIREYEGALQSAALQKIYLDEKDPIWQKRAAHPVEGHRWIGFYEDIPEDLEIPEGEFYYDETKDERTAE